MWSSFLLFYQCLCLLSLFGLSVSAPAPTPEPATAVDHRLQQTSSLRNSFGGDVHTKCAVRQQPADGRSTEGPLLSQRDCLGNEAGFPINYWSFYPYTTAIRTLNTDEKTFFGPLGYHSRDREQRATDQTYQWYIPKKTKTVKATETIHHAAVTETVYMLTTTTAIETTTAILRETTTKTAIVYRLHQPSSESARKKLSPTGSSQKDKFIESPEGVPRHSTAAILREFHDGTLGHRSDHWASIPGRDNSWRRRVPVLENRKTHRVDSSERNLKRGENEEKPSEAEELFVPESAGHPETQKDVFFNPVVVNVAQMTGFIIVGIILATLLVLLFIWCSQPLWALGDMSWRLRPELRSEPKMHGARSDTEHGRVGIAAPNNTGHTHRSTPNRRSEFVSAITSPGAMDGASSPELSILPIAVTTGAQTVSGHLEKRSQGPADISSLNGARSTIPTRSRPYLRELFSSGNNASDAALG